MAKGGSAGGKCGGACYAGKAPLYSGKSGAVYAGIGGRTGYNGMPGPKGQYRIGTDGASLLGGYKGIAKKVLGTYMGQDYGIDKASKAMKSGMPYNASDTSPGHGSDLVDFRIRDQLRYKSQEEENDIQKPCAMCGAPAPKGSAFCFKCISGRGISGRD